MTTKIPSLVTPASLSLFTIKVVRVIALILIFIMVAAPSAKAQQTPFDLDAYNTFLDANANLSAGGLMALYPAGTFSREAGTPFESAYYADSVRMKMRLTSAEEKLGNANGFFVTERLSFDSFGSALREVYTNDLPVFISTDAVLHAIHMSYNLILQEAELNVLEPKLRELLADLHAAVPALKDRYGHLPDMAQPLNDLDVYLTVPRKLLEGAAVEPVFDENAEVVQTLMDYIADEGFVSHPLFSEVCRMIDYSQFTPRGHYTDREELTRYFQAMIWLGRTEIYLSSPQTKTCKASEEDVQRQTVLSLLVDEAMQIADTDALFAEMESIIQLFVGESDNVTLDNLRELRSLDGGR